MTDATPAQLDLNLRAIVQRHVRGLGWAFRPQDAFVIGTGINYGAFTWPTTTTSRRGTTTSARIHMNCRLGTVPTCSAFRSRPSSGRKARASDRILK